MHHTDEFHAIRICCVEKSKPFNMFSRELRLCYEYVTDLRERNSQTMLYFSMRWIVLLFIKYAFLSFCTKKRHLLTYTLTYAYIWKKMLVSLTNIMQKLRKKMYFYFKKSAKFHPVQTYGVRWFVNPEMEQRNYIEYNQWSGHLFI